MEIIKLLTCGRIWWLAVTLHRICIIIIYSFEIGCGAEQKVCEKSAFLSAVSISVSVPCGWCVPSWRSQSSSQRRSLPSRGTSFIHVSDLFFAATASLDSHRIYYRGVMRIEFIRRGPTCAVWLERSVKVSSPPLQLTATSEPKVAIDIYSCKKEKISKVGEK